MADPTPLMSQPDSLDTEKPLLLPNKHDLASPTGSTIDQCIGEFNCSQFLQAFLVSLAWIFDAQQTFITVFTDALPPWHCTGENDSCSNMCNLPNKDSWAWDGPREASMISEWALECQSSVISGLPTSMFFVGCLVGGLVLATLADTSLGRKNMLFYSCLFMSLSSLFAAFSPNVWIYSALKFVSGFGRATIGTSALILASELVGERWRGQVGVMGFLCFDIGFLSLPAMAYANSSSTWRNLYLWTSIPTLFYCILIKLLVNESPRWLLVRGRREEAMATLKRITSMTQSSLNLAFDEITHIEETKSIDFFSAFKILLQKNWSKTRLSAIMAMGIGIGLVYFGMPLGLDILSFNLYLSVTFNALSELPSSFLTSIIIDKFNRRSAIVVLTMLSGVSSVMSIMEGKLWTKMQIWFELISFFSACTSFNIYLIYTTELFPTCVRNSALSMARLAVVFGGMFSPLLAGAGRVNKFLCFGVFGLMIGCSGLFVVFLPETKGRTLCDTIDEEESKEKIACNILA